MPSLTQNIFVRGRSTLRHLQTTGVEIIIGFAPPILCIGSMLRHLISCKARGALPTQVWPSSYYWPLIYPDGDQMADFVNQYIVIKPFYSAKVRESVFNGYPKFKILVLNIDCTES